LRTLFCHGSSIDLHNGRLAVAQRPHTALLNACRSSLWPLVADCSALGRGNCRPLLLAPARTLDSPGSTAHSAALLLVLNTAVCLPLARSLHCEARAAFSAQAPDGRPQSALSMVPCLSRHRTVLHSQKSTSDLWLWSTVNKEQGATCDHCCCILSPLLLAGEVSNPARPGSAP